MKVANHFIICDNRQADDIYEMDNGLFVWRYWDDNYNGQRHWNEIFKPDEIGELFRRLTYRYRIEYVKQLAAGQPFYGMKPIVDKGIEAGYKKSEEQLSWEKHFIPKR